MRPRGRRLVCTLVPVALLVAGCGAAAAPPAQRPAGSSAPAGSGTSVVSGTSATPTSAVAAVSTAAAAGPSSSVVGAEASVVAAEAPVVVLDPGHNGGNSSHPSEINRQVPDGRGGTKPCNTTGTETDDGYPEHAFAWDVALRARAVLERAGVTVVLTRAGDTGVGPCIDERGRAGEAADADAVVSIHADGSAAADSGFHVAYSDPPLNDAQRGPALALARDVRDALRAHGFTDSDYIGADGLSPRPDLGGLNHATRPTVLVECANMRNPTEAASVSSPEGRQRYAEAVAAGVLGFLG